MKLKWWHDEVEGVNCYRFSIYRLGSNMQTVYCFQFGNILIDSAQRNSRVNIKKALADKSIDQILLTHYHEDHTGNVAYIAKKWNAKVFAHPKCAKLVTEGFSVSPLGRLISGAVKSTKVSAIKDREALVFENYTLEPIFTPGHTDDHVAYYEPNKGWLFSGDLYVADRIKYFESNESIQLQIESLKKLVALDFDVLFCSHNPKYTNGKKRLERKLELFENFYGEVIRLDKEGYSEKEILKALGRKENYFYKYMTIGNFTAINMVKSVLKDK